LRIKFRRLTVYLTALLLIMTIWLFRQGMRVPNASAVETDVSLGVYWDLGCTQRVDSVDWGTLTPGQVKNITLYIRNEASTAPVFVFESANNWDPIFAYKYIDFVFDSQNAKVQPAEVKKTIFSVAISWDVTNVESFSFNIVLKGTESLPGDLNNDGTVNIKDIAIFIKLYKTTSSSSEWNPNADLNGDGRVDMLDIALALSNFAKTAP
jgi:hypothetical protein